MKSRACALLACMLVVGCGGGAGGKPKPISGPAKQVATVIARLQTATAKRDFATICDTILASSTRRQAGGDQCATVLGQRANGVRRPRIRIEAIEVQGNQAQVRVRTTAVGQVATRNVIRLVRENGAFRVLSLGR